MAAKNIGSDNAKNIDSFEESLDNNALMTEDVNWLSNHVPVTIFRTLKKLSWGMDFISKNVEKLTGYSSEDFTNKKITWFDIVFPEDIPIIEAAVKNAKKNKSSYQIEYRIKKSDGKTLFVQEQANVVCNDKGEPSDITGIFLDFTDQKIQLEMLQTFVKSLSHGEIPETITGSYSGNLNEIKNSINACIDGLQGIIECNNVLHRMALNDHTKGVEGKHEGIFASMGEATNEVRDRVLKVTEQINDIAVGNTSKLPELKKVGKRSEQDHLLPAVIEAMENINLLIEDTKMLAEAGVAGRFETRADISKHHGEYKEIVLGINDTLDAVMNPLNAAIEDSLMLSEAAIAGKLSTRADVTRHRGNFLKIIKGFNDTLDAVIGPLNVAAEYVERISRGDIPKPITDNYNGDFNEIKNNLNTCIVAVNNLVADAVMLSEAGVAGRLDTRADASKHEGDFRKVVEGVNDTLDAVIGPLNVAAEYVERISRGEIPEPITDNYNGDFNEIKNNLNKCISAVNYLVEDALMLSKAGIEGRLNTRADASKHEGDFRKIVEGVNDTLDAVVGPLNVAAEYVERISCGEIPEPITDNYNGDFNVLKNNINNCIEGLQGLVECNNVLQRMAVNDNRKGVEGKYVGIYASMGEATNNVRARVLNVTKQLNNIAVGDSSELESLKKIGKRSEQDQLLPAIIRAMENVKLLIEDTEILANAAVEGKLDTRANASRHQGEYRKIVQGVNDTLDAVIGPLNVAAEYVERISRGDIPEPITDNYNGDFNEIKNNLNTCIVAVNNLVADAVMLSEAGVAGRLDTRADATRHEGDFRKIVAGVNDTLDAVIGPLNVAAEYVERISRGDIPKSIMDNYNGDFNEIKNNLNKCIGAVNYLVEDALMLSKAAVDGKLDTRANASKHEGDFRKVVEGVNDTLDAVIGPLNVAAEYVERISRGDIPKPITDNYNGDFNEIKNNLNTCIVAVNNLVADAVMLSEAGVAGRLDTRADATRHEGDFRKIVAGVNDTLDAVIGPLNVAAEYVERISRGDIPKSIMDNYNGDFNEIKNNLNKCIGAVNYLVEDALMLSKAGIEGRLNTRADASKHEGDFRRIVEGVNDTLDAVIGPLNVAANYVERISRGDIPKPITDNYNGDFNEIKNNLNKCISAVNYLVEDSLMLSKAAIDGKLDTRANASKHEGDFKKVVVGVNDTLDAVIGPLNVAAEYVERISRGDIPKPITDNYNGDFNEIKNNLNTCIVAVNNLVADAVMLSEAGVAGRLDTRADATRHEGDFRKIVAGVNETLDAVIGPLNVAAEYVERISRGDIPKPITDNYNGDFNEIKNNLNKCISAVNYLVEDALMLSKAAVDGKLDTRANASKHEGDFRKVVEGVNDTLDAVIGPLNVAADYVERISRGDIPKPITDSYNGDFNEIKNNLNKCISAVNYLVEDSLMLSNAAVDGKLDTRANASKHEGDFKKVVVGVNATLDAVIGPLNVAAEYVERISRGEIPEPITDNYNGDFNVLKNNINNCIEGLQGLVECNNILKRMAVNDQTKKVEGNYVGIFASMGEAINLVQARVLNVTNVLEHISVGNTSRLEELKKIGRRSEQDRLLPAMIKAMENINILIEDTEMLSKAAVEGKLGTRADASRHQGEYIKVIEGINETLDAVIGPLNVAADYVESISRGDIPKPITDNYNGDFNAIKNNLNTCIIAVNNLVADAVMLSEAGIAGKLNTRANASTHQGDFRKIVVGVNNTLDAVIGPVNEAIKVSNEFSNGNFKARVDEKLHVEGDFINFKNVLNNIGVSVSDIIISAKSVTLNVVTSTDEASRGADEVARAAGNVADSSQKSSELTRELLTKIGDINREIVDLSKSNENIAITSKGILSAADEVVRIGKNAQTLGKDTNQKMESVEKIARESVVGITSLTEQIKQIDGIVQLINDITSQINLLSLNAAIEAARAGEHGRGFAVVAGEVKNLATKARNATETIENVVNSVQRDSKKTADAINTANVEIIDGVNSVNKTLDALNTIIKNATQVTNDISDITKAIEKQATISLNVVKASEEGKVMTEEVQREAEGLAAVSEETSASIQEIGASIHEIANLSNKLKSEMEAFAV